VGYFARYRWFQAIRLHISSKAETPDSIVFLFDRCGLTLPLFELLRQAEHRFAQREIHDSDQEQDEDMVLLCLRLSRLRGQNKKAMGNNTAASSTRLLLEILDQGYERKAWHGPNLRGSLRGISAHEAAWRPGPSRHNIWEIAVHAAYWKYVVRRRAMGEGRRGSFPLQGSNWFVRPDPNDRTKIEERWRRDRSLLQEEHRKLVEAVSDPMRADSLPVHMVFGIAFHDVYHAGQIQLLKRLCPGARAGSS